MGERGLRVEIHRQHPVAVERRGMGEMQRHGGLAGAALEVGDGGAHARLPAGRFGISDWRLIFRRRRSSLISSSAYQRWRPSSSTSPLRQGGVGGQPSAQGRLVDLEDQLGHLPAEKRRSVFSISGEIGLLPDPALHLERLRLQRRQILMGEHALPPVPCGDVNSCQFEIYAGFAKNAKSNIWIVQKDVPAGTGGISTAYRFAPRPCQTPAAGPERSDIGGHRDASREILGDISARIGDTWMTPNTNTYRFFLRDFSSPGQDSRFPLTESIIRTQIAARSQRTLS
jgi:hypothetical protein